MVRNVTIIEQNSYIFFSIAPKNSNPMIDIFSLTNFLIYSLLEDEVGVAVAGVPKPDVAGDDAQDDRGLAADRLC
jgi:hypothetical protein|uniref:Uncharacterized protein n=1 Tax=Zea mays TaxID=4577 RepID=B6TWN8_MAIZE|nr:hypothetical protein [Zea mays]